MLLCYKHLNKLFIQIGLKPKLLVSLNHAEFIEPHRDKAKYLTFLNHGHGDFVVASQSLIFCEKKLQLNVAAQTSKTSKS
jgi:hypothetical protein